MKVSHTQTPPGRYLKKPRGRKVKYPWDELAVHSSFKINSKTTRAAVSSAATHWANRHPLKFDVKREGDGYRVYRIAT